MTKTTPRTARETPRAAAAYAEYAAMPPQERSLTRLAARLTPHDAPPARQATCLRQLKRWSADHGWQERVKAHDAEMAVEKEAKRLAEIEAMNERHAQIGTRQQRRALAQIEALIAAQKFGSQATVQLLKLATDLERTARGAPTSVEQHEVVGKDGGPIQHEHILSASADFDRAITALLERAATGGLPGGSD